MKLKEFELAAAGHDGTLTNQEESLFFKLTVDKEIQFYNKVDQLKKEVERDTSEADINNDDVIDTVKFFEWLPVYLGEMSEGINKNTDQYINQNVILTDFQISESASKEDKRYIVLQNLLYGYNAPNILDIKIGKILYDNGASDEKKLRLDDVSRTTTSGSLGVRICGMKIKNCKEIQGLKSDHFIINNSNSYYSINKFYGRSLKGEEDLKEAFKFFFEMNSLTSDQKNQLKTLFLTRLQLLYNTILDTSIELISSSLLFIYETDTGRWDVVENQDDLIAEDFFIENDDEDTYLNDPSPVSLSKLKLIDFAHAEFRDEKYGYDENFIVGIESLINIFKELQN